MSSYEADGAGLALQLEGLWQAVGRLRIAAAKPDGWRETYLPLFEALNWSVSLDQRVQHLWRPAGRDNLPGRNWRLMVEGGERVTGVEWARNLVHHQWVDALRLDPSGHGLYPSEDLFPSEQLFPKHDHAWVWRDADDLPKTRERRRVSAARADGEQAQPMSGHEAYTTYLQGMPAAQTMAELLVTFELVGDLLKPPTPRAQP